MNNNMYMKTDSKFVIDQNMKDQMSYIKPLIVNAGECYKLMTNPQKKSDELSETTKTWLKEKALTQVLGIQSTAVTKHYIKGMMCIQKSIDLYNQVMRTNHKESEFATIKNGFRARPTLLSKNWAIKIVSSWDAGTFPFFREDVNKCVKRRGLDWQCRVYMMVCDVQRAFVCYCMVDTPHGDVLLDKWDDMMLHNLENKVVAHKRISISEVIERDLFIEQKMRERYAIANRYFQNYLEEIYNK